MKAFRWLLPACVLALSAIALPASADQELRVGMAQTPNVKPAFLGAIPPTCYDRVTDDLLTARGHLPGERGRRVGRRQPPSVAAASRGPPVPPADARIATDPPPRGLDRPEEGRLDVRRL